VMLCCVRRLILASNGTPAPIHCDVMSDVKVPGWKKGSLIDAVS
jgi:hypothetical protein